MSDSKWWIAEWQRAREQSVLYSSPTDPGKWMAFWDHVAPFYAWQNRLTRGYFEDIVRFLVARNALAEGRRVLDIGCGPGTYSLPMASAGALVTGLDSAPAMLAMLAEESRAEGVDAKIRTIRGEWDEFGEEQSYHLVLAALTPAIKDYASLCKMRRLSAGHCCLISFKGRYCSSLRDGLWARVMGVEMRGRAFDIIYPFNILYAEGYLPELNFFPHRWEIRQEVGQVKERYRRYFAIFGKDDRATNATIEEFVDASAEEGSILDVQEGALGVLLWATEPS
jgi:SAM-dependent methyltransferase